MLLSRQENNKQNYQGNFIFISYIVLCFLCILDLERTLVLDIPLFFKFIKKIIFYLLVKLIEERKFSLSINE